MHIKHNSKDFTLKRCMLFKEMLHALQTARFQIMQTSIITARKN